MRSSEKLALDEAAPAGAEAGTQRGFAREAQDRGGQRGGVAGWNEKPALAVPCDFAAARRVRRNDGPPARRRFEQRLGQALCVV